MMDVWQKIKDATDIVRRGIANKVEPFTGVLVYRCGTIIRIDIKGAFPKDGD